MTKIENNEIHYERTFAIFPIIKIPRTKSIIRIKLSLKLSLSHQP
jgi:hypothetical protein